MNCTNAVMAKAATDQKFQEGSSTSTFVDCNGDRDVEPEPNTYVITITDDEEETNPPVKPVKGGQLKTYVERQNIHKCPTCLKVLTNATAYRFHLKTHEAGHKCDQCNTRFVTTQGLAHHIRTHLGIRPYQCPYCPKDFTSGAGLHIHARMHQGLPLPMCYSCKICSLYFHCALRLDEHLNREHSDIPTHVCVLCEEQFFTFDDLYKHERTHLKSKPLSRSVDHVQPVETVHKCIICQTQFSAATELIDHMNEHLPESQRKNLRSSDSLTCTTCEKIFDNRIELTAHIKIKNRKNKWGSLCRLCNQLFLTHCHLIEHLYPGGSTGSRYCDQCEGWFAHPCGLEIHRTTHFQNEHAVETPQQNYTNGVAQEIRDDVMLDFVGIKEEMCDDLEEFIFIGKKK